MRLYLLEALFVVFPFVLYFYYMMHFLLDAFQYHYVVMLSSIQVQYVLQLTY
jgi:hypothetical protein